MIFTITIDDLEVSNRVRADLDTRVRALEAGSATYGWRAAARVDAFEGFVAQWQERAETLHTALFRGRLWSEDWSELLRFQLGGEVVPEASLQGLANLLGVPVIVTNREGLNLRLLPRRPGAPLRLVYTRPEPSTGDDGPIKASA